MIRNGGTFQNGKTTGAYKSFRRSAGSLAVKVNRLIIRLGDRNKRFIAQSIDKDFYVINELFHAGNLSFLQNCILVRVLCENSIPATFFCNLDKPIFKITDQRFVQIAANKDYSGIPIIFFFPELIILKMLRQAFQYIFRFSDIYRIGSVIFLANQKIDANAFYVFPVTGRYFRTRNLERLSVPV